MTNLHQAGNSQSQFQIYPNQGTQYRGSLDNIHPQRKHNPSFPGSGACGSDSNFVAHPHGRHNRSLEDVPNVYQATASATPLKQSSNFIFEQTEEGTFQDHPKEKELTRPLELATPQQVVMPNHCSFYGSITGEQAEYILMKNHEQQCYLTRYSKNHEAYILSVKEPMTQIIIHYKLSIDNKAQCYEIQGTGVAFNSFEELLSYYEHSPIDATVRSIGSPCVRTSNHQRRPHSVSVVELGSADPSAALFANIIKSQHEHNTAMFRQYSELMLQQQNFFRDMFNMRRPLQEEDNQAERVGRGARQRQRPAEARETPERQAAVEESIGPEEARHRDNEEHRDLPRQGRGVGQGENRDGENNPDGEGNDGQELPKKKCIIL